MTLGQVRAFTEAAERAQRRNLVDQLANMRVAFKYEKDDYNRYFRKLSDG